jgi:outer membrane protein OmpA-like peptidoglycan-associated protein
MLIGTGIDGARIETIGHGESEPVADNRTAAGRQQNRRVELTLVGQQLSSLQPK